jgi:hypothetical protein
LIEHLLVGKLTHTIPYVATTDTRTSNVWFDNDKLKKDSTLNLQQYEYVTILYKIEDRRMTVAYVNVQEI